MEEDPSLQGFADEILKGKNTGKKMIASSHYPLKCSDKNKFCQNDTILLKSFFDLMFENDVKFYIGAHHHTYERVYPYCQNNTFQIIKPPYMVGK